MYFDDQEIVIVQPVLIYQLSVEFPFRQAPAWFLFVAAILNVRDINLA